MADQGAQCVSVGQVAAAIEAERARAEEDFEPSGYRAMLAQWRDDLTAAADERDLVISALVKALRAEVGDKQDVPFIVWTLTTLGPEVTADETAAVAAYFGD